MTVIDTLITDRTQADETRAEQLAAKGWAAMTTAEREEWLAGPKGAYNATDLNRVTAAIEYLNDKLSSYGYATGYSPIIIHHKVPVFATDELGNLIMRQEEMVNGLTEETYTEILPIIEYWNEWEDKTWTKEDAPTASQMVQYLDNVHKLKSALKLPFGVHHAPSDMNGLTVQEANNIEQILLDIDKMLTNIAAAWFYSGEIYAGEFI